ncbi:hypothetical protein E2P81_ATG00603 [Venturia nashicola]|nr:hypothetical protein E2P81_ATG00603 [Venturia nashicola]
MSSFINKSGKKVAPKGAPRRRAGGPPAATPVVPQPSIQPAAEKPQDTLLSNDTAHPASAAPAQLPTPNATQIEKPPIPSAPVVTASSQLPGQPDIESTPAASFQISSIPQSEPQVLPEVNVPKEPIATVAQEVPRATAENTLPTFTAPSASIGPGASPPVAEDDSRPAKRRRVEEVVDVVQVSSIPTEVIRGYSRPPAPMLPPSLLPKNVREPAAVPASEPIVASSRPRAKGARKDQWQVSTPTDVTTGKGKRKSRKPVDRMQIDARQEAETVDELNQPSVVTLTPATDPAPDAPEARKVRKDKGVKRTSKTSETETSTASAEALNGEANGGTAGSETIAAEPATEGQGDSQPLSAAAQKRLANAQKRKAKQLAKTAALSKAAGRANAAAIDKAVAQSIEGRAGSSSRASTGPTFIVTPGTPNREGTAATSRSSVAATERTEGGTVVRRAKRSKRAETPEENEAVFIVESQTSMFDLAGRDTENRVGFKSEREKAMRLIDWDEVKKKRKAEDERMARMARGKRNQDDDYDPEEEGMDEDEILARRVARNKNKRPGLQITLMANGEHGIDEQSQMIDRHRINEDELELLEEVEEDDLTKKFNVQTYGLWRRKEEDERIPHNERWTFEQTDKFYDALTSFGTDFMIISTMFPGMTRRQIKAKFVREERQEPERIRDALTGHNSGRRNGIEGSGWDLKVYCEGAGLSESAFLDPKKIREELDRERVEREKEIEEARAEAAEEDRQRKLAGALNGDDELDSDGEPLSPGAVVKRAKEVARQKKLARLGEKKRKIMEMAGGSEEVVESIEDD